MNSGFYSAFTGLASRMQALDVIANNLANVNTIGFKSEHEFYQALRATMDSEQLTPVNLAINDYGVLGGTRVDLAEGSLKSTGNDTDLAIDGPGFFSVRTKGGIAYTRNGSFRLNTKRQLVTSDGDLVIGQQGPIELPSGKVTVGPDGTVSVNDSVVDQLRVVEFAAGTALVPAGNTYFNAPDGAAKVSPNPNVQQGMLEASNSDPVTGAVALIELQRNAELMERALSIFHNEFNQTAAQQLPQVS